MKLGHPEDRLVMGEESFLVLIHETRTSAHTMPAFKVVVALDGGLDFWVKERLLVSGVRALWVAPRFAHRVGCSGASVALFLTPGHFLMPGLRRFQGSWGVLEGGRVASLVSWALQSAETMENPGDLPAIVQDAHGIVAGGEDRACLDRRVARVKARIDEDPSRQLRLEEVARSVGLSSYYLARLFAAEVGMPMRSYCLWRRTLMGVEALHRGASSITEAAYCAGFSDHAHFTRACRRFLGQPPRVVPRERKIVQEL